MGLYLSLMMAALVLSAFVSALQVSFLALQMSQVKHLVSSGVRGAGEVERIAQRPDRLLATTLFSNNLLQSAAAALGTVVALTLFTEGVGIVAATLGMGVLTLLFAEVVPMTFAARHAERLALLFARPFRLLESLLSPVVDVVSWLGSRLSGGELTAPRYQVSEEEIRSLISAGEEEGAVEETAAKMLHRVFEFSDRLVKEVMTPRTEVVAVPLGTTLDGFLQIYRQHPYSRFPLYRGTLEEVEGFLAIKDVLMALAQGTLERGDPIDNLVRPVSFVPETKPLGELLPAMQAKGTQMAIVVDEFGGVAGVVTVPEMIEEIVGGIRDEMGWVSQEWVTINESTFQVDGGLRVEEANETLGLQLPQGDYQTVAGLFLSRLGHIPREGEQVRLDHIKMVVTQMRGRKIERILITRE